MRWAILCGVVLLGAGCADEKELARQAIESTLLGRGEVIFTELTTFPGKIVCGKYEALDKWGESGGTFRFIYNVTAIYSPAPEDDWDVFCSEDSAARLYEKTGINVSGLGRESLARIRQDFSELEAAMAEKNPDDVDIPNDPWGRPYHYIKPWFGGIKGDIKLLTLGADGVEGGENINADIGNWQMKYIDHIERL